MVQVKITFNPYLSVMTIYVNNQPIPLVSRLTRFQTLPFGSWCTEIFQALADEVNDDYSVQFIGRPMEAKLLQKCAMNIHACKSFSSNLPIINESAANRLKKLSSLCQSGVPCTRFTVPVQIYTDYPEDMVRGIAEKSFIKLSYCKLNAQVLPLHELCKSNNTALVFVISKDFPQLPQQHGSIAVLNIHEQESDFFCQNGCFIKQVLPSNVSRNLSDCFELLLYPIILEMALSKVKVGQENAMFTDVAILDKIEPQTYVSIPRSIELGEAVPITIRTVPAGYEASRLTYRISDESVIQIASNKITAVGVGEAIVEAYIQGQTANIFKEKITAFRRNRITTLKASQKSIQMSVGDRMKLSYSFEPSDADNERSIHLVSTNGTIAAVDGGMSFTARAPGKCRIIMEAEKGVSDSVSVEVFPRLEALSIDMSTTTAKVGDIISAPVSRIPEQAVLDQLIYKVSPPSLGDYDVGLRSFCAKEVGEGTLTVTNKSGTVKATHPITVRKAASEAGIPLWVYLLAGAAVIYFIGRLIIFGG